MCLSPKALPEIGLMPCRKCWQCRDTRVDDLVGRCIAETNVSDQTLSVTLTYDDEKLAPEGRLAHAHTLVYKDVQDFLKRLRYKGHKLRYIVTGEYGSDNARAHWHIILFLRGKPIDVEGLQNYFGPQHPGGYENRVSYKEWPWGFCYFQKPEYKAFRYVLKYVLKDQTKEVQTTHLAMSKKPPLGNDWIIERAKAIARQGLPVHDFKYSFRDQFRTRWNGLRERREFMLHGIMRQRFLETYVQEWENLHGGEPPETDLMLEHWFDPIAEREMIAQESVPDEAERLAQKTRASVRAIYEDHPACRAVVWSEATAAYYSVDRKRWLLICYEYNKAHLIHLERNEQWLLEDKDAVDQAADGLTLVSLH